MKRKLPNTQKLLHFFQRKSLSILLPIGILAVFLFLLTINNVYTQTYNIERFNIAKETIYSPITIENQQETERRTRQAIQSVEDRYDISQDITSERTAYITEIFDAVDKLENGKRGDQKKQAPLSHQEKLERLKQILSPEITEQLNDSVFANLLLFPKNERSEGEKIFLSSLKQVLEKGVRSETIQSSVSEVKDRVKYSKLDDQLKQVFYKLADFAVVENSFFDANKTSEARKEAANNVDPAMIRAGEIIVRKGQTITNEVYEELKLVGLLNKERNVYPLIGLAILIVLIAGIIAHEMIRLSNKNELDKSKVAAILLISMIVVSLMKAVSIFATSANQLFYIVPVAMGALLMKLLIGERIAIIFSSLNAIMGTVIFNGEIPGSLNIEAGIYFFFSQIAAVLFLRNVKDRLAIMKAGAGMSIVNILTVLLFIFLSFEKYAMKDVILQLGFGFASAFIASVLTIGLLPFFETVLGILSDIKLLQLSSPNQPLLKKILTEAPGTYHHSVMVANLSESACDAIGANGLLARVGAYYHDLGKTVRPLYFIENQMGIKNPHDYISPAQSAEIIIRHPYDGAEMLKQKKMPKEIIDIAMQHHGTSLLKYFYYKEKEKIRM
ncbi:HDIG domain-containing protein [Virgibacillus sp. 179-BFC.A HS]|uniref:HDIG domain-containing protein n=1 Tax=Tigheibacillus jepli TaxID=3035914 RepID=A0ABU5CI86_9BACI|nr:HDIG domain-containing metalloprotein [Virgibacillus sp. 179-BFC.A HS]MDY0405539.1 HDIG domain-containing protein [Virgibacillus sp. 179-BFC.A HS]